MADSSMHQYNRGRSRRGRGPRSGRGSNRIKSNPTQHDRRGSQGRSRPLPLQRRDDSYTYPAHMEEHSYPNHYWEPPPRHPSERESPRIWWHAFNQDQLPHTFQPRECIPCGVFPRDPWGMVSHLSSLKHFDNYIKTSAVINNGRDSEKDVRCEICQSEVPKTRRSLRNHFTGRRHRFVLNTLRRDMEAAGFAVPAEDELRQEGRSSAASSRSMSTEERRPDSRLQLENRTSDCWSNEAAAIDGEANNSRRTRSSCSLRGEGLPRKSTLPDSETEPSTSGHERIPSTEDRRSDDEKNAQKHKYFVSSDEERSDDENLDIAFEKPSDSSSKTAKDPKPKVPLISAKSLVDKRKAIISKLSNYTDAREITKQLRQISRIKSQERVARKALPGVPYSDREIEQQETFGEARAQRTQTEVEPAPVEIDDDSDAPPVVKKESRTSNTALCEEAAHEECTIVPSPARPPPETISDSDTEEQLSSTPQRRQLSTSGTPIDLPNSQMHASDYGKIAAIVAQERALSEKLRYLGQTLPCIEALISQMRQEHQNAVAQIDLLRTAKNRLIAGISQGSAPQSAGIFNPNSILSALLQPNVPNGFGGLPWTAPNGNLSSYLHSLGLPERTISPSICSNLGLPNGTCSAAFGTNSSANNSYAEPPPLVSASNSISAPATPVAGPSSSNDRKRSFSRDSQSSESKRSKNGEFDEQLHSEVILVVRLSGNYVYTSSKDGVVKRTPLQDGAGSVTLYKHSAEDSNSKLSRVWANVIEVVLHKKLVNLKVITGSNDCAVRVFDGESGRLMKVVPVQARVQCGIVHWQKIYVGLKSGYIQVYNLADQRYIVESQHKQVPKLMTVSEIRNSKSIIVVTEENSVLIRDAGTLFVLHAIDRLDQEVKALMVKDDHILLCGTNKLSVFDKNAELSLTVDLTSNVFCAIPMKSGALLATTDGILRSCKWKGIFLGNENVQNSIAFTRDSRTVVTSMDGADGTSTVALATDSGRVVVVKLTSKSC